jgi:hypothetical protein
MAGMMKKWIPVILLTSAGAAIGLLYWRHVGCQSGSCPITSNPYVSGLYGGLLGFLAGDFIKGKKGQKKDRNP